MGLDPEPFTWRELDDMAFGKRFDDWDRAAALMMMLSTADNPQIFNPLLPEPDAGDGTYGTITDPRLVGGTAGAVR